ncbi:amidohydrolase family protein [Amycolatopsis sp. NPDC050768]|uniref:amidohydrolase family protein n=1 Tax=Amycolatopsis sp. NPDC050768 TaxID=3154839 RepID=UPI0033D496C7
MKKTLLKGGSVLTMDPALGDFRGDVLIGDDRILDVAPKIDESEVDEVIDAADSIVLPGLIDCHNHLWQAPIRGLASSCWGREYFGVIHPLAGRYRPQDMHDATFGAGSELLLNGVTTVFDFCHATNSTALPRIGGRARQVAPAAARFRILAVRSEGARDGPRDAAAHLA